MIPRVLGLLFLLATLCYPFLIYWGMTRWSPRVFGWILALLLLSRLAMRLKELRRAWSWVWAGPALCGCLCGVFGAWLDEPLALLLIPSAISSGFLLGFAWSLQSPPSAIEHFARMMVDELSAEEVRYCRVVTFIWVLFFLFNILVSATLAFRGSQAAWTFYNGLLSYLLMGALFGGEFLYRHWRFRRYIGLPSDPILKKWFPPRT